MEDIKDEVIQGVIGDSLTYVIIGRVLGYYGLGISYQTHKGFSSFINRNSFTYCCSNFSSIYGRIFRPTIGFNK